MTVNLPLLRSRLTEIRAELSRIRTPWAGELIRFVETRVISEYQALETLASANAERQREVREAIHRAADRFLSQAFRRVTPRREWTSALWRYLERRFESYGLQQRPCLRSVRSALNELAPPGSDARLLNYAAGMPEQREGRTNGHQNREERDRGKTTTA